MTAQHTPSSSTRWASGGYLYDGAGNVTRIGGAYFLYDGVSRLKEARLDLNPLPGAPIYTTQTYSFDGYGNLTAIGGAGGRNLPTSATSNRLTSGTYDLLGNLVSWNLQQSVFDSLNLQAEHCTSWQSGSCVGERWLNIFTASEERLYAYRTSDGLGRWTLRDLGDRVLRQFSLSPAGCTLDKEYLYRDGLLAAELVGGRHFTLDHLGSPRLVTDASGTQVAWHTYYPFGEEATTPTQNTERLKFTAHERDLFNPTSPADDLDYLHARFSSLLTGRFLSVDTLEGKPRKPQSWNRYAYALGNPQKYIDPDGREAMIFIVAPSRADTNPKGVVGHSAIYVTSSRGNAGVSAFGDFNFSRGVGEFIRGYVDQGREVMMFVLKTTAEQDAKMVDFIQKNPEGGIDRNGSIMTENCTGACVNVLQAGGVVKPDENPASYFFVASTPNSLEQSLQTGGLSSQVGAVVTFPAGDPKKSKSKPPTTTCPEGQHPNKSGGCS